MMQDLIEKWKQKAIPQKRENKKFLQSLQNVSQVELFPKLLESHEEAFRKIDCLSCANCCKSAPALLINSDIKRIAKHLSISPKQFERKYVLEDVNGEKSLNRIPCSFLNEDNTCSIYEIRPQACRRYPHTDEAEYRKRIDMNVENTIVCPAAFHILENLKVHFPAHDL